MVVARPNYLCCLPVVDTRAPGGGGKYVYCKSQGNLEITSPRPRRVVIATPARKVGEAKGTYQAGGSTLGPPGLGIDRDMHMDI